MDLRTPLLALSGLVAACSPSSPTASASGETSTGGAGESAASTSTTSASATSETSADSTTSATSTSTAGESASESESESESESGPATRCGDGVAIAGELCLDALAPLTVGGQPVDTEVTDLDLDGANDLAIVDVAGPIHRYYGLGDGVPTFEAGPMTLSLVQPRGVAILGEAEPGLGRRLAVADMGFNAVALYRSDGPRSYLAPQAIAAGSRPRGLVAADLDGDGDTDLAAANQDSDDVTVILFGEVDGDEPPTITSFAVGDEPYAIAAGDLNGDGAVDLATANRADGTISILLGDGDGGFAPATAHTARPDLRDLAIGDVNGDGHLDVVAASFEDDKLTILGGTGDGLTFTGIFLHTPFSKPYGIAVGDLDHDGIADLVATDLGASELIVIRGLNHPLPTIDRFSTSSGPIAVTLGDLNGDGALDVIVAATYAGAVDLFLNDP